MKIRAAWLYFVEGLTQEQVAKHLGISRVKATRLLAAAREDGTVHTSINAKAEPLIRLQRALEKHLGLYEAVVVPAMNQTPSSVASVVGHATGKYISQHIENGMSVGVGWGATLQICMRSLVWREVENLTTVSLLGGLTHATSQNPSAVAWRFVEFYRTEFYQITAPAFVENVELASALWAQRDLKMLKDKAANIDLALISVSDVNSKASIFERRLLSPEDQVSLHKAGAVGDVLCHFVDETGNVIDHPINGRVMAINPNQLRKVPRVIISSGGVRKAQAIHAGILATNAKVLITDEMAARALLEMKPLAA
ncbi:sugar-binding transcriptional regulator [Aquamicrobium segne]|uniref:Sugar-binding transcriptional regulator n=1 Tax=Aquamicrobium segne TaxID=469547 RepID=A0ABW0H224_9HYPH